MDEARVVRALERMAGRSYAGLELAEALGRFEMDFWGRHRATLAERPAPARRVPPMELVGAGDAAMVAELVVALARRGAFRALVVGLLRASRRVPSPRAW